MVVTDDSTATITVNGTTSTRPDPLTKTWRTYVSLPEGPQTLSVEAKDGVGNRRPAGSRRESS